MDMLNILRNFDAAEKGKKPSAAAADANEMKSILESFNRVTESDLAVDECGAMPPTAPEIDKVTMNVNLNARGTDAIEELIALMGGKSGGAEMPVKMKMPMPMPKDSNDERGDMAKMIALASDEHEGLEDDVEEDWDNAPEEEYADHDTMIKDLSGGINREKKQFKAAQPGDNAMAVESIKDRLWAALNEKKAKPDFLDVDKDGNKKETMKKALKDKKKK